MQYMSFLTPVGLYRKSYFITPGIAIGDGGVSVSKM